MNLEINEIHEYQVEMESMIFPAPNPFRVFRAFRG